jgi:guanylate kinase
VKKSGRIIIISGPSGSGKTTLHKKLLASAKLKGKVVKSVSMTTRSRRAGEKPGRDYIFISPRQFESKQKAGHFLESQKVFDYHYGTPAGNVKKLLRKGKYVLLCIDVKGAKEVWQKCPDAFKVFIRTPTLAILKERLKKRGTENPQDLKVRLNTARHELAQAKHYDYVIVNDDLAKAYRKLEKWVSTQLNSNHS